jgi:hypothetical protein
MAPRKKLRIPEAIRAATTSSRIATPFGAQQVRLTILNSGAAPQCRRPSLDEQTETGESRSGSRPAWPLPDRSRWGAHRRHVECRHTPNARSGMPERDNVPEPHSRNPVPFCAGTSCKCIQAAFLVSSRASSLMCMPAELMAQGNAGLRLGTIQQFIFACVPIASGTTTPTMMGMLPRRVDSASGGLDRSSLMSFEADG